MNFWHNASQPRIQCCIRVRWPPNQIRNLIKLYRDNPCLWNKDDPRYLDYCARRTAYRNIYDQIKDSVPSVNLIEVIVKLREVRKYYVIELRKQVEAKSEDREFESRYAWFDEIDEFLRPHLHTDERADAELASAYSSNYCDETPSPRSPSGSSVVCPSSDTPKNSDTMPVPSTQVRNEKQKILQCFTEEYVKSQIVQLIEPTNSRLTERKSCDEFDIFGMGVACRLRRMSPEVGAQAKMEIKQLLTDFEAAAAACELSTVSSSYTCDRDCNCEVILPYSRDKGFTRQESCTNYTI